MLTTHTYTVLKIHTYVHTYVVQLTQKVYMHKLLRTSNYFDFTNKMFMLFIEEMYNKQVKLLCMQFL